MPVVRPGLVFAGGAVLFAAALVPARLTDGWSLALLIPLGALLVVTGGQWLVDHRGAWDRVGRWQERRSRPSLLAMGLTRSHPEGPGARIVTAGGAIAFGLALIAVGIWGVANAAG